MKQILQTDYDKADKINQIYSVGQLKWGQLTFLMVTFECIQ